MASTEHDSANTRAAAGISHAPGTRTIQQPLRDHSIPARYDNGEAHSLGGEIAFDGHRLAFDRIGPGPERKGEPRLRLYGKDARLPVGLHDGREASQGLIPALGAQPVSSVLMHGIEGRHLNQHIGGRGKLAIDKLQVAQRRQKRRTAARLLLPSGAGSEPQR
jgi:hypothetical protein